MTDPSLRVLIADDEPVIREYLRHILEEIEGVQVIGEAENGYEAVAKAKELNPHVLFLDIEMPDLTGLQAARILAKNEQEIFFVFVTVHPDFALQAFDIYSFDYILKPFRPERVQKTVGKIRELLANKGNAAVVMRKDFSGKLVIKCGFDLVFIDFNQIIFLEKDKKKTIIYTVNGKYETYESINEIGKRMDYNVFFRGHKSYLINLDMVERLSPGSSASLCVHFKNCTQKAYISRLHLKQLVNLLGKEVLKESF
ncbi:MAG: LytTR family DNA-binding domain-containing protein [Clostridia bacterium]|nr:LytTR family DNA-binding domain-containing protein [Clostridia bacterium]